MIAVHDAEQILISHLADFGEVEVSIVQALGRVLCEPLIADRDFPPYHRVAMDGFALSLNEINLGRRKFVVSHLQQAGIAATTLVNTTEAIEVMTGAMLPNGCNVVIAYEDVTIETNEDKKVITIHRLPEHEMQHVHLQGADRQKNEIIVEKGKRMTPPEIAVAASIGKSMLKVSKLPKIAIVTTGDELVDIDQIPLPHQIRQSNALTLNAFLFELNLSADSFHVRDNRQAIKDLLSTLLVEYDVIITSGGVSVGAIDYLPAVFEDLEVRKLFHKIEQRPGKPMWFGRKGNHFVFGLPGNPVSIVVCFLKYVRNWLMRSMHHESEAQLYASIENEVSFLPKLHYFLPVKIESLRNGVYIAIPLKGHGSGDFANLVDCDGFLELPSEKSTFYSHETYPFLRYRTTK